MEHKQAFQIQQENPRLVQQSPEEDPPRVSSRSCWTSPGGVFSGKDPLDRPHWNGAGLGQVQTGVTKSALTLGTFRSLAPARAEARPETGRSSAGENSPAGRGGAGGGGGAPGGTAGAEGERRLPPALSVGGSGGGGGGGGWPAAQVGLAGVGLKVEEGGRGGGGGGAGMVDPGLEAMSGR